MIFKGPIQRGGGGWIRVIIIGWRDIIYCKDVDHRPSVTGEESIFQSSFHCPVKRYPFLRGEPN